MSIQWEFQDPKMEVVYHIRLCNHGCSQKTRRTRYRRTILPKTWFDLHSSSAFWLKMVSCKMLRFASGCNTCSVSVLQTSRIDSAAFSFVSIHSFARAWPVFTSKDSEPSSQRHCWLRMYSFTPPHPHVVTKQVSGVASQWRSKCNVRCYPNPPHPHVVTKQVSGVASQWRSKCNVRYSFTPPHPHVVTKQVSGVASQWRSKCNVRCYPTPPHPHVVTKQVSGVAS